MKHLDSHDLIYAALSPESEGNTRLSENISKSIFEGKIAAATLTLNCD